jgi:hypothetical protein
MLRIITFYFFDKIIREFLNMMMRFLITRLKKIKLIDLGRLTKDINNLKILINYQF